MATIDNKLLDESAKILTTHHDELTTANQRIDDLKQATSNIQESFSENMKLQDDLTATLSQLNEIDVNDSDLTEITDILSDINQTLDSPTPNTHSKKFEDLDTLDFTDNWQELLSQSTDYAKEHQLDLSNPYYAMMSPYEYQQLSTQLVSKYDLSHLTKDDYAFSSVVGLIMGLVDILLVRRIHAGSQAAGLQKVVDNAFNDIVVAVGKHTRVTELISQKLKLKESISGTPNATQLAKLKKLDERINEVNQLDPHNSQDRLAAIRNLEKHFKVNYDAANNASITGAPVNGMSANNHHLLSLAHDPGILGLIVGIVDQVTGRATFIDENGKIIRTTTKNINGISADGPLPVRIAQAAQNWLGHTLSDIAGSSSSKGRGEGLPAPFYALLKKLQFGAIPIKGQKMTIGDTSEWLFRNGLDFRALTAQAIPVLIGEALVRAYWFIKQCFYYGASLKESIASSPDLHKLLLTNTAVFSTIDLTDASIHALLSPNRISELLLRLNYVNLVNLGFKSIQAIRDAHKHQQKLDKLDDDLEREWERLLT
ncbi:hypothetical protein [Levilactobacillus andaensis]|uniref:hypothetical protein n=1 Tax=Levilactobacillus andaensis TaxID=2799570 RepID=UPI001941E72D|nr:hypothetical protein [Levilactobacillus andaensis]